MGMRGAEERGRVTVGSYVLGGGGVRGRDADASVRRVRAGRGEKHGGRRGVGGSESEEGTGIHRERAADGPGSHLRVQRVLPEVLSSECASLYGAYIWDIGGRGGGLLGRNPGPSGLGVRATDSPQPPSRPSHSNAKVAALDLPCSWWGCFTV